MRFGLKSVSVSCALIVSCVQAHAVGPYFHDLKAVSVARQNLGGNLWKITLTGHVTLDCSDPAVQSAGALSYQVKTKLIRAGTEIASATTVQTSGVMASCGSQCVYDPTMGLAPCGYCQQYGPNTVFNGTCYTGSICSGEEMARCNLCDTTIEWNLFLEAIFSGGDKIDSELAPQNWTEQNLLNNKASLTIQ